MMLIMECICVGELFETLVYTWDMLDVLKELQIAQSDFSQLMWTVIYVGLEVLGECAEYATPISLPSFFSLLLI